MVLSDWYKRNKRSLALTAAAVFLATTTSCAYINKSFNVNERKAMAPISQIKQDNRKKSEQKKQISSASNAVTNTFIENKSDRQNEHKTKTYTSLNCDFTESKGQKKEVTSIAQGLDKLVLDNEHSTIVQNLLKGTKNNLDKIVRDNPSRYSLNLKLGNHLYIGNLEKKAKYKININDLTNGTKVLNWVYDKQEKKPIASFRTTWNCEEKSYVQSKSGKKGYAGKSSTSAGKSDEAIDKTSKQLYTPFNLKDEFKKDITQPIITKEAQPSGDDICRVIEGIKVEHPISKDEYLDSESLNDYRVQNKHLEFSGRDSITVEIVKQPPEIKNKYGIILQMVHEDKAGNKTYEVESFGREEYNPWFSNEKRYTEWKRLFSEEQKTELAKKDSSEIIQDISDITILVKNARKRNGFNYFINQDFGYTIDSQEGNIGVIEKNTGEITSCNDVYLRRSNGDLLFTYGITAAATTASVYLVGHALGWWGTSEAAPAIGSTGSTNIGGPIITTVP